ncbi:MAG: AMP-binding protein [Balneolaceae bacterium]|nr:AMP-binding protein [Balneolaceae bacterium]MBO6544848.1 AMP-binding protein [Balneolaceae bacterium]MBO6646244.1 AMP-binding protein [Balneolaceae bacterium]
MNYKITSLEGSGKDIIRRVMLASESQLLIPPKLEGLDVTIPDPPRDGKYIGLFSSGTTSNPKCIWNRFDRLELNAQRSARAFEIESDDSLLMMALPWHVAGFSWMLTAEQLGSDFFFVTTQKGGEGSWIKALRDVQPDYLLTVPAVLRALYDEDWFVPNVVYGGYPIKFEEYKRLSPHCSFMHQGYGQTEAGGLISSYKRKSTLLPSGMENFCNGKAIEGVEMTCIGSREKPEPILITSETAYTQNIYNSGDVGFKDEEGNIYVVGRTNDLPGGREAGRKELLGN